MVATARILSVDYAVRREVHLIKAHSGGWIAMVVAAALLACAVKFPRHGAPDKIILRFPNGFHGEFRISPQQGVPSLSQSAGTIVIPIPETGEAHVSRQDFAAFEQWHTLNMRYADGAQIPLLLDTYSLPQEGIYGYLYGYSTTMVGSKTTSEQMTGLVHNPPLK